MSEDYDLYGGQLRPDWRERLNKDLDKGSEIKRNLEATNRQENLPKQILIFGGGIVITLTALIIYKYKKK